MGEIAEMMLDGTLCEACGAFIDDDETPGHPRYCSPACARDRGAPWTAPKRDVKAERAFAQSRPVKNLSCVHPGCAKKFRPSTAYRDFLLHWQDKHAPKEKAQS